MSVEKVKNYFDRIGVSPEVIEFEVSSATVELAARAVGVEEARIAKSLSFKVGEKYIVLVTAGDVKIDNHKYKGMFHQKAHMLSAEEVTEHIGYNVGGVCSFDLPDDVDTYLDESLKRFETVYPAAGGSNNAVKLTPDQLAEYSSNFKGWVDVTKPKFEQ